MERNTTTSTLEQIRAHYPFEIPMLAQQAGVGTVTVYHALLQKPINTNDAKKLLIALSQYTGLQLSLDQVAIVTWEDYLFLWIIRASREEDHTGTEAHLLDEYTFVYARDKHHATRLAHQWLAQRPYLTQHAFTPCPEGFTVGDIAIPGHLTDHEKKHTSPG